MTEEEATHDDTQNGENDLHDVEYARLRLIHYGPDGIAKFVGGLVGR